MKISDALKTATEILQKSEIEEARREAGSLVAHALQKDKTFLIAHSDYELSEKEEKYFKEILERRANREPFQYIVGKQEFFNLEFLVSPSVLIPRPETELIVEEAIEVLQNIDDALFCEVGTGSGCISVAILHEIKSAKAIGLEISEKSLEISRINAEKHKVSDRLEFRISDVFSHLNDEKFDLIVSNPPYIPLNEVFNLQPEVCDFEPLNALTDGENGLSIIEKIITEAPNFLKAKGVLLMEIGFEQASEVEAMFLDEIWYPVEFLFDLQGIARTVKASIR